MIMIVIPRHGRVRPGHPCVYSMAQRKDVDARNIQRADALRAFARGMTSGQGSSALPALVRAHQIGEPLEQIMRVARAGGALGMVLHREHRLALELDAAIGAVKQRDVVCVAPFNRSEIIAR